MVIIGAEMPQILANSRKAYTEYLLRPPIIQYGDFQKMEISNNQHHVAPPQAPRARITTQ